MLDREEIKSKIEHYKKFLEKHFPVLGSGKDRVSYKINDSYVVKNPVLPETLRANYCEAQTYEMYKDSPKEPYIPLAACKMIDDILLLMEYVKPIDNYRNVPEWVHFTDGGQVGINSRGKLVCYDYGE